MAFVNCAHLFKSLVSMSRAPKYLVISSKAFSSEAMPQEKVVTTAELDDDVERKLDDGLRHKEHPGRRALKCVSLPTFLERAALRVVSRHKSAQFRNDVHRMYKRVFHHQLPTEGEEIRTKKREITEKVIACETADMSALSAEEKEYVLEKRQSKVNQLLKNSLYGWKDIEYDDYSSTVYLAARLAGNYAALMSVFKEIRTDDPQFRPKTLFDFGSGIGSTMYAANEVWPASLNEHFNIDLSEHMNDVSRLLLKGGDEKQPLFYNGVFYRPFLPISHTIKYDMVVSAFSLLDLPSQSSRINVIENLWHKTQDMLVIVEHGNRDGFQAVLEARNFVLGHEDYDVTKTYYSGEQSSERSSAGATFTSGQILNTNKRKEPQAHIVAPCPHHLACPRLHTGGPVLCNFEVPYMPLDFGQGPLVTKERYSYIVIKKGPRPDRDTATWPRIVQPVLCRNKHVICRMCCPDGSVKSLTFTKGKHKGHMYETAKSSNWGDLMPATVKEIEKPLTKSDRIKYQKLLTSTENSKQGENEP